MNEKTDEFFARKAALAKEAVDEYLQTKKPILIVIDEKTANIFCCVIADSIAREFKNRQIYYYGGITLAYPSEKYLILFFQEHNFKIIEEMEHARRYQAERPTQSGGD